MENQSFREASDKLLFFLFPLTLLSSLFSLFQESLVDFWFQKSWIAVVFHQAIYQSLRPVEAIWPRLREILTDFFSRHTVNVYLCSEDSNFYFTHELFLFRDICALLCLFRKLTTVYVQGAESLFRSDFIHVSVYKSHTCLCASTWTNSA